MKNNKGITIIALILTIIVTILLAAIVINEGTTEIDKAKIEDLEAKMLLIKGRAKIVVEKESFGETYNNEGMLGYLDASTYTANIPSGLSSMLTDTSNLYIWTQEAMDNNNIDVEITTTDFFIIDYSTLEIYSSIGYLLNDTTYYSLSQIQAL